MRRIYGWLVVWLSPLVVAAVVGGTAIAALTLPSLATAPAASMSGLLPSHPRALEVERQSAQTFGVPLLTPYLVVQRNASGLSSGAIADTYRRAYALYKERGPADLRRVVAVPIVNPARTTIVTYVFLRGNVDAAYGYELSQHYAAWLPAQDDVVGVTGSLPARIEQYREIKGNLTAVEIATVLLIVLIVGLAFRALVAPLLTIVTAGIAFVLSQHVLGWVTHRFGLSMPQELRPVAVALMLGIVTDYSVFFLNGTRQLLRNGAGRAEAVRETTAANAPIVLAAGLLVAVGLGSLLLGTLGFFRTFGPGMAITVLCGLAVSLTFVPAMLALLGTLVFWPGLDAGTIGIRRWRERLVRLATHRAAALVLVALSIAVLVLAAFGLRHFGLGLALERALPSDNPVARAAAAAGRGFPQGILAPTELDVRAPGIAGRKPALARLQGELKQERGVALVLGPADRPPAARRAGLSLAPHGDAARYLIVLSSRPTEAPGLDALRRIQHDTRSLLQRAGLGDASAAYAGESALGVETVDAIDASLWRIALGAFAVNLVFLSLFLRAVLAPLYLLVASALGLAATFGVTTWFFHTVLGYGGLPYYLPVAVGVLLVSLGSDYNLFVVGRIWQEAERRPLRDAIAYAAPRASRAITVAGLALALSFVMLAIVPIEPFAVLAFAMAVGILIDALLVRTLLVPALIALVGRAGWWPRRLGSPAWTDGTSSSPEQAGG